MPNFAPVAVKESRQPPMSRGTPDDFQTPGKALDPLLPFIHSDWKIWEPACGKGNLVRYLEEKAFKVIGTDLNTGQNFLLDEPPEFDCIITNPPYSLKEKFLEKCYLLDKPFALLLPLTALESEYRQKMYRKFGLQIILFNKRVNFETPSGKGSGTWFATAWFCNKLDLPNQLNFVKVDW